MSVRKFRTFEEARRALWLPAGDPGILRRMRKLAELARARPSLRGVHRFRTIEEAKASKGARVPAKTDSRSGSS